MPIFVVLRDDVIQSASKNPRFLHFANFLKALLIDGRQQLESIIIWPNRCQCGFDPPQENMLDTWKKHRLVKSDLKIREKASNKMLYKIYYVISLDVLKTQAKKNLKHKLTFFSAVQPDRHANAWRRIFHNFRRFR